MPTGVFWPEPNGATKLLYHLENTNDDSGNNKNLTNHGADFAIGAFGDGANLGTSGANYLSKDSGTGVDTSGSMTCLVWLKFAELPTSGNNIVMLHLANSGGTSPIHELRLSNSSGIYTLSHTIGGTIITSCAISIAAGKKHNFGFTTDGSTRILYYDGAQVASG